MTLSLSLSPVSLYTFAPHSIPAMVAHGAEVQCFLL